MKTLSLIALMSWGSVFAQTKDEVKALLDHYEVQHSDIVLRQSIVETGWFKCTNCSMRYNNLFGFRLKKYMSENNPMGYIPFDKWQDSVRYYKEQYQDKNYKGGDYYIFLKEEGYSESPTYTDYLKKIRI